MLYSLDMLIFVGFLILNLVVGLYYGRGVNTIKEYSIGNKDFSTMALVCTLVATWTTGSGFFTTVSRTYSDGLYYLIADSGIVISFIFSGLVLIPRMGEFMQDTSAGESMGRLYGKSSQVITAICGTLWSCGSIGVQFKVFGAMFTYFLKIPSDIAIFMSSVIVILYSAFGGIRSITFTDILQFFTFCVVLPLIGILIFRDLDLSSFSIESGFSNPIFDYTQVFDLKNERLLSVIPLLIYFSIPAMEPVFVQRIAMGKNVLQAKKVFLISAAVIVVIELMIAWIPFLIYNINPNLNSNEIISYVIDNYSHTGLKGMIIIGVVAMSMSTSDALLNSTSVLLANDLCKPLGFLKKVKETVLVRIFSVIIGCVSIYLALRKADLLSVMMMGASFYMPVITIPFTLAILGFRSTPTSVLIGMLTGFITVIYMHLFVVDIDPILPGMLVNLVFFMGSHYILRQNGGWVGIKDNSHLIVAKHYRHRKWKEFQNEIQNFNFIKFCSNNAPKEKSPYSGFGIFCIMTIISAMYSLPREIRISNYSLLEFFLQTTLVMSTIILTYPIWPTKISQSSKDKLAHILWNFGIFYILIFSNVIFLLLSKLSHFHIIIFTVAVMIVFVIMRFKIALITTLAGIFCAVKFYKYYFDVSDLDLNLGALKLQVMYALLFISAVLLIFLRPHRMEHERRSMVIRTMEDKINEQNLNLARAISYKEAFLEKVNSWTFGTLNENCKKVDTMISKQGDPNENNNIKVNDVHLVGQNLKIASNYLNELIAIPQKKSILNSSTIDVDRFLSDVIIVNKLLISGSQFSIRKNTKAKRIECDVELIKDAINTCVKYVNKSNKDCLTFITVDDGFLEYDVNRTKDIKASVKIFIASGLQNNYNELNWRESPELEIFSDINLIEVRRTVYIHFGKLAFIYNQEGFPTHAMIEIPQQLNSVRSKSLDASDPMLDHTNKISELYRHKLEEEKLELALKLHKFGIDQTDIIKCFNLDPKSRAKFDLFIRNL